MIRRNKRKNIRRKNKSSRIVHNIIRTKIVCHQGRNVSFEFVKSCSTSPMSVND
jgi:hypothetical protein